MNIPRILVVGDVILDRYWDGVVDGVSRDGAVPVLRVTRRFERPGGAANVAANLAALGAAVSLVSLVGDDADGERLGAFMDGAGVAFDRVVDPEWATTVKLRCVSNERPLLRANFESPPPSPAMRARLAQRFLRALAVHDMVVFSDYAGGALDDCATLVQAALAAGRPVLVDPAGGEWSRYAGATLVKPPLAALEAVLGVQADAGGRERLVTGLRQRLGWRHLLLTQAESGMTLYGDAGATHEPARAREARDATGAGDTVIATLAWRLAEGDDVARATRWASVAAGLAVQKFGTAVVSRDELVAAWDDAGSR